MNEHGLHQQLATQWKQLLDDGEPLTFRKGQVLSYEGHHPLGLFVIRSGKVSFSRRGIACEEDHLWQSPKGGVIGLEALVKEEPLCCTATAKSDCKIIFISRKLITPLL